MIDSDNNNSCLRCRFLNLSAGRMAKCTLCLNPSMPAALEFGKVAAKIHTLLPRCSAYSPISGRVTITGKNFPTKHHADELLVRIAQAKCLGLYSQGYTEPVWLPSLTENETHG